MKLKTSVHHTFDIDPDLLTDLEFTIDIPVETIKVKTKIIEVKKKSKIKQDASTRLF